MVVRPTFLILSLSLAAGCSAGGGDDLPATTGESASPSTDGPAPTTGASTTGEDTGEDTGTTAGPTGAPTTDDTCGPPAADGVDPCAPACAAAGGNTCDVLGSPACDGLPAIPSSDCAVCCTRPGLPACGEAGGNTCAVPGDGQCDAYPPIASGDCPACCLRPVYSPTIMTWNIASTEDRQTPETDFDIDAVIAAIAAENPDIIALQEVQENNPKAGGFNQTVKIAVEAGYPHSKFGAAFDWSCNGNSGRFGVTLLSKFYMHDDIAYPLNGYTCPGQIDGVYHEPRVLYVVHVDLDADRTIYVAVTHLSPNAEDQAAEAATAVSILEGLGPFKPYAIVMGDLNARESADPASTYAKFVQGYGLTDVWLTGAYGEGITHPDPNSPSRIDFLLTGTAFAGFAPTEVHVSPLGKSDHLGVFARVHMP